MVCIRIVNSKILKKDSLIHTLSLRIFWRSKGIGTSNISLKHFIKIPMFYQFRRQTSSKIIPKLSAAFPWIIFLLLSMPTCAPDFWFLSGRLFITLHPTSCSSFPHSPLLRTSLFFRGWFKAYLLEEACSSERGLFLCH